MKTKNIIVIGEDKMEVANSLCRGLKIDNYRYLIMGNTPAETAANFIRYFHCLRVPTFNHSILFLGGHMEYYDITDEASATWLHRKDKDLLEDWERGYIQRESVVIYAGDARDPQFNYYRSLTVLPVYSFSHFERKFINA